MYVDMQVLDAVSLEERLKKTSLPADLTDWGAQAAAEDQKTQTRWWQEGKAKGNIYITQTVYC